MTATIYGDPAANAPVWSDYAVLLGGLTATTPTGSAAYTLNDGTVTNQWDPVGALDSDTPFDDGDESVDTSDHTAAGFGVYATTTKNQKETISFTAKEKTLVTLGLMYDTTGLTDTAGTISGELRRRDPSRKFKVSFHRENGTDIERRTTNNYATIDSISRSFGNDESTVTVTMLIVPGAAAAGERPPLYDYYYGPKA